MGTVRSGTVRYGTIRSGTVRYDTYHVRVTVPDKGLVHENIFSLGVHHTKSQLDPLLYRVVQNMRTKQKCIQWIRCLFDPWIRVPG
jgi:hypothetical protein